MIRKYLLIFGVTALVAVSGIALAGSGGLAPVAEQPASVEEILAQGADNYADGDVLVDTEWVEAHLDDENVRLLDVGTNRVDFETGHLRGAVFVNMTEDFVNPDSAVNGVIPTAEQLEAELSERGVENDDIIVVYDSTSNLWATRAFWVLTYFNHEDVRLYDGGEIKWEADGNRLSRQRARFEPSEYVANEPNEDVYVSFDYIVENLDNENVITCDTRSEGEYAGTDVRADRGGHIPGAIHLEWVHAVNEDGTFKPVPELAALFYAEGFTPDKEILTYCQTGVRGAHTWFVLTNMLGYPNVRNYDGSWIEYGNSDAPLETPS